MREALTVPALGDLRAAVPSPSSIRPPESWSSVAAVMAVIAADRPGIRSTAEPSLMRLGLPRKPGEDGHGVGAVGLGGPGGLVPEPLALPDELELLGRPEPEAPVADVEAELHSAASPGRWKTISGTTQNGEVRSTKRTASAMSAVWIISAGGTWLADELGHRGVDEPGAERDRLDPLAR